mgnify:CR=1 FL=1
MSIIGKKIFIANVALLILIAAGYMYSSRTSRTDDVQNSTDRTLERVESQQQQVNDEISGARNANSDAKKAVERASAAVGRGQKSADEIASGIEDIQRKVAECRKLAERNAAIFDETERANQL